MEKNEKLKIFAANLRQAREKAGLSKPQAASILNIKPAQYYRYEAGTAEPGIFIAINIAKMLNISTTELFRNIEPDISRVDTIINKLSNYGIHCEKIKGDPDHLIIPIANLGPLKHSIDFAEKIVDFAETQTQEIMQKTLPDEYAKCLEALDKETLVDNLRACLNNFKKH